MLTTKLYQKLVFHASIIYHNLSYPDDFGLKTKTVKLSGLRAEIFEYENHDIVVFCGTNSLRDWLTNIQMIFCKPRQFYQALELVLEGYDPNKKTYIIGHSLGGAIAEYVGNAIHNPNLQVVTFNGAGIKHLINPKHDNNIVHFVTNKDILNRITKHLPFSLFKHIGEVKTVTDTESWCGLKSHGNWNVFMRNKGGEDNCY